MKAAINLNIDFMRCCVNIFIRCCEFSYKINSFKIYIKYDKNVEKSYRKCYNLLHCIDIWKPRCTTPPSYYTSDVVVFYYCKHNKRIMHGTVYRICFTKQPISRKCVLCLTCLYFQSRLLLLEKFFFLLLSLFGLLFSFSKSKRCL